MRNITTHSAPVSGLRGIADTYWQARGACHWLYPEDADELFFASGRDREAIAEAKALCATCPVRDECLDFAVENGLKEGVWGGCTPAEREPRRDEIAKDCDDRRVVAVIEHRREVHLNAKERGAVIDRAYARGWRADRLAVALRVGQERARDLLTEAAHKLADRGQAVQVPQAPKQRKRRRPTTSKPATSPAARHRQATVPVKTMSANTPLGKAV
ncbi:WhiB family transcriptional regulator [Streptomyces sp. SCSIO 30461]|uniref:WhiB family transcriptional regulator n=1 Tax=Streptomyces sp. SCSIO 30461 TaxID=3118085 RepID=UPI0030D62AF0